jgi:purine nucleoside phosphorylase
MATVGIITGSGTYALPGLESEGAQPVDTRWGSVDVSRGRFAGVDVLHVSRHGDGHTRLSNHVNHRANIRALKDLGADAVIGCTACGAVDPSVQLGSVVVFDDLHFISNRLPDGSLCTFFDTAGDPDRAHWIIGPPICPPLREALVTGASAAGVAHRDGGCYGHVDGPRFNTPAEIRQLAACGVTAVSQTGGPEVVLSGELELPYAIMGFATDYANAVVEQATPVAALIALMGKSTAAFAAVLAATLPALDVASLDAPGTVYRFAGGA